MLWLCTNVATCYRIEWFLGQLSNALCGEGFASARTSMKKDDEPVAFPLDNICVSFARDPVSNKSLNKLLCLVVSD